MPSLAEHLCDALRSGQPLDEPLHQLVLETKSRAAGCWLLRDGHLDLIGFASADDMPHEVDLGFRDATRQVPLDQQSLGIVKAVITGEPAIGRRDPKESGLDGSATWIAKFAAQSSLAVPIRLVNSDNIVGVLAVSTADIISPEHPVGRLLVQLSVRLGEAWPTTSS